MVHECWRFLCLRHLPVLRLRNTISLARLVYYTPREIDPRAEETSDASISYYQIIRWKFDKSIPVVTYHLRLFSLLSIFHLKW